MVRRAFPRRVGAAALTWLTLQAIGLPPLVSVANAAELPKVVVVPFTLGEGAPEKSGSRFAALVVDELKTDRKSTRLNSSHIQKSRMPSSA